MKKLSRIFRKLTKTSFLHTFNRKSVQKLSAVIFELKIFRLVAEFPASNAPWLLAFDFLNAFISIADAQLKQARLGIRNLQFTLSVAEGVKVAK